MNYGFRTLLRANAGKCGRDTAHSSLKMVRSVDTTDCLAARVHEKSFDASLFCAATLQRYGLPYNYTKLDTHILPKTCACCNAPMWDPGLHASRVDWIFVWQSHLGRCGGDGLRLHAYEPVKLAMKRLALSCPDHTKCAFPRDSILIEPPHLLQVKSLPRDIYAVGNDLHMKDTCMDVVITTAMQRSCLSF